FVLANLQCDTIDGLDGGFRRFIVGFYIAQSKHFGVLVFQPNIPRIPLRRGTRSRTAAQSPPLVCRSTTSVYRAAPDTEAPSKSSCQVWPARRSTGRSRPDPLPSQSPPARY